MKQSAMEHGDFSEEEQVFLIQRHSTAYVGERMTPNQLAGIMRRFTSRADIKITPHQIRHLVATTLANRDMDDFQESGTIPSSLNNIKDFLGHENISTTIGYIEPRISNQRKLIKGLELPKGNGKALSEKGMTASGSPDDPAIRKNGSNGWPSGLPRLRYWAVISRLRNAAATPTMTMVASSCRFSRWAMLASRWAMSALN